MGTGAAVTHRVCPPLGPSHAGGTSGIRVTHGWACGVEGWEPLRRSSAAPCTGSQTELPRAPGSLGGGLGQGQARVRSPGFCLPALSWHQRPFQGLETTAGARFLLPLLRPGAQSGPCAGPGRQAVGGCRPDPERKGKLRPGAGDPAKRVQLRWDRPSLAPQGLCSVPRARSEPLSESTPILPSRLHPQTFETPGGGGVRARSLGAGPDRRAPLSGVPAPAGSRRPRGSWDSLPREPQAYFQTIVGKRVRPRPALPPARAAQPQVSAPRRLQARAAGRQPSPRGPRSRGAFPGLRACTAAPPGQVPAAALHRVARHHQRGDKKPLPERGRGSGSPSPGRGT